MTNCVNGYTRTILIKLDVEPPVIAEEFTKCSVDVGEVAKIIFLTLIFIISFALCILVIVTICTSKTLKKVICHHLIINLCVTVMLDCLLNLLMSISYVATFPWRFGFYVCYFNGFTINMLTNQMGFSVLLITIDRILVSKKYASYLRLSKIRMSLFIVGTWATSVLIALPLVWGFVQSVPYKRRYSCGVADPNDEYYLIIHFVVILILCTCFIILFAVTTMWTFHVEQNKHKKVKGNQTFSYLDQILMTPYYKNEIYTALFMIAIVSSYIVLFLPFSLISIVDPILTNHWRNISTFEQTEVGDPDIKVIGPKSAAAVPRMLDSEAKKMASNASIHDSYLIPEVFESPVYQTCFIWTRYIFDMVVPILVLFVIKDIRNKTTDLIFACRSNTVGSSSPKITSPPHMNATILRNQNQSVKDKKKNNAVNYKTPVLFATAEGLHIRTVEDTFQNAVDNRPLLSFSKGPNVEPTFTYDLCDVTNEDNIEVEANYHINDQFDFDEDPLRIGDGAVNSRKPSAASMKRPPTPPRTAGGNNLSEAEDYVLEKRPNKKGNLVKFNTQLNIIIPPSEFELESPLNLSIGSRKSNDSGNVADIEEHNSKNSGRGKKKSTKNRPAYPGRRSSVHSNNSATKKKVNKNEGKNSLHSAESIEFRPDKKRSTKIKSRHLAKDESNPRSA